MVTDLVILTILFVVTTSLYFWTKNSKGAKRTEQVRKEGLSTSTSVATPPPTSVLPDQEQRSLAGTLGRSRGFLGSALARLRSRRTIVEELWIELEEILLLADVGLSSAERLVASVRSETLGLEVPSPEAAVDILERKMIEILSNKDREVNFVGGSPSVVLFVGVNGVGKTTTIGKVASSLSRAGKQVVIAAGDTFRAAASEQLDSWAQRSGVDIVKGSPGGDPASVIFDAITHAGSKGADVVLCDTAGRLQNRFNLMEELKKIRRVAEKADGLVTEVLLVLDATTGQNGLIQAKGFSEASGISGIVLTKLDGTAKGGVAFAIEAELSIPIKLVGVGEGIDDLIPFDPEVFVREITAVQG